MGQRKKTRRRPKKPAPQRAARAEASEPAPRAGRAWLFLLIPPLALTASLTLSYLWNEDFFWYLTSGRAVLEAGGIPASDPFLYTENVVGWVYHSWLWTVLVAAVDGLAGLEGVVVFHFLVAAALAVLVYTTARTDRLGLWNALAVTLFLVAERHRLGGKAEVASWLMVALFFRILEHRSPFDGRKLAALLALQVLWANLHGGYPLGVLVALAYGVGAWLERRRGAAAEAAAPPVWLPLALFAAAIADPWKWKERLAPFGFVFGSETYQPAGTEGTMLILEWRSPFDPGLGDPQLPVLWVVAALAGLASFVAARRWPLARLFFFLGMAGLAATAVRHLGGLALAAALVGLANLGDAMARREPSPGRPRPVALAAAGALTLALLASAVALRLGRSGFEAGESETFFTTRPAITAPGAAHFVLSRELPAPIFNDYQLGAYLSERLHPQHRLFIDSRVLDPELVVRYTRMVSSPEAWRSAESRYGFKTAVLGNYSKTVRSPLGATLQRDPAWRLVYLDPLAVVFVKDRPRMRPVVRPYGPGDEPPHVPFLRPPALVPPLGVLQRLFLNDFPSNYLVEYLAVLGQLGRPAEARELADRAIEALPRHPLLRRQRCAANAALGDLQAALEDCRTAHELRPGDPQIVSLYALVLERRGDRRQAAALVDRALRQHPRDPELRRLERRLSGRP